MKAVVAENYGPAEVLKFCEVPDPVLRENEILIRIHASTVTLGDCELRAFKLPLWIWLPLRIYMGFFRPRIKIFGQEYAGTVEKTGEKVKKFKTGDRVFGPTKMELGAHAEFIKMEEDYPIGRVPEEVNFQEAAAIPTGGLNALHFIDALDLKEGDRLLVNGAGGSIGTLALQLAKLKGVEITAVDTGPKLSMLSRLGAKEVIDFTREDPFDGNSKYDVVLEISGKVGPSRGLKAVERGGTFISANPNPGLMLRSVWTRIFGKKKVMTGLAVYEQKALDKLTELVKNDRILIEIDKCWPLSETADAHRYVESGSKQGHVIILNSQKSKQ